MEIDPKRGFNTAFLGLLWLNKLRLLSPSDTKRGDFAISAMFTFFSVALKHRYLSINLTGNEAKVRKRVKIISAANQTQGFYVRFLIIMPIVHVRDYHIHDT
jgi:hypothetical protein